MAPWALKACLAGALIAAVTAAPTATQPLPLEVVRDVPLPGGATRFDYISIDPSAHRIYLAHMGDDAVIAFDTTEKKVLGVAKGIARVRGVLAVPRTGKVYAAAAGSGEVVVLQAGSLEILARIPAGNVDGLDFVDAVERLFVSDQRGGNDVVIDARSNQVLKTIPVGGDVGNTRFDPSTGQVLVAVGSRNELVAIDPRDLSITGRYALPGIRGAHGIALDPSTQTAFLAGEGNSAVCAFSLKEHKVTAVATVGKGVDVLDVDPATHLLFVASEAGVISIFDGAGGGLRKVFEGFLAPGAHVVGVDPSTHLVYFPLKNVGGRPVLRIMRPIGDTLRK